MTCIPTLGGPAPAISTHFRFSTVVCPTSCGTLPPAGRLFRMTDFVIDPPVRILGRRGSFVRSTDQAAAFMREHMLQHVDGDATEVLRRLEDVGSAEEAQDAAAAFRRWIASGLLAMPGGGASGD